MAKAAVKPAVAAPVAPTENFLSCAPYMAPGSSLSNIPLSFVGKIVLPSEGIEGTSYNFETATVLNDEETVARMSVGLEGTVEDENGAQTPLIAKNQTIWGGSISTFSKLGKVWEESGEAYIKIRFEGKKMVLDV